MFGLDRIGQGSVEEAHKAVNDAIARIEPLLTKLFMMARALIHGALDRIEVDIKIKVHSDPGPNPPPKE